MSVTDHLRNFGLEVRIGRETGLSRNGPLCGCHSTMGKIVGHQSRKVVAELLYTRTGGIIVREKLSVLVEGSRQSWESPLCAGLLEWFAECLPRPKTCSIGPVGHDFSVPIDRG